MKIRGRYNSKPRNYPHLWGKIDRALPVHGKTSIIHQDGKTIYQSLPNPFAAIHYHSLIFKAEEAFVTNSILELMPLTKFDSKLIGTGKPSRLTRELLIVYRKIVDEALQ
jgi:hypothetical protein